MAVYVDDADIPYMGMLMSHMWADTLEELLDMADKIGVRRKWIQGHPTLSMLRYRKASWVHFDIAKGKKLLAIHHGARKTDKFGPAEHCAKQDIASGDEKRVKRGTLMLERLAHSRAIRTLQPGSLKGVAA